MGRQPLAVTVKPTTCACLPCCHRCAGAQPQCVGGRADTERLDDCRGIRRLVNHPSRSVPCAATSCPVTVLGVWGAALRLWGARRSTARSSEPVSGAFPCTCILSCHTGLEDLAPFIPPDMVAAGMLANNPGLVRGPGMACCLVTGTARQRLHVPGARVHDARGGCRGQHSAAPCPPRPTCPAGAAPSASATTDLCQHR